ncbi:MAG: hypothetical protein Q7T28_09680 [Cypionkella sp.]|uniref:hypothetical protein n=1 Tax=Cypionkella sp. TaxID=2811411 RepID=UPI00271D39DF|nr:hypothetical protein [Cypionkella sp.]MDO8327193.1 hypothetical protein [Cypionkella sp.]
MTAIEEIEAMLNELDLFERTAVDLTILCCERGNVAMAEAIAEAAKGLVRRPGDPDLPLPDDGPWLRLRACVSEAEHHAWAQFMFAALNACDHAMVDRVQALVVRRCAN